MLTPAQNTTLKNYVLADPVLSLKPATAQGAYEIAQGIRAIAAPAWYVFRTDVPVSEVQDKILYANMTPAQAVPATDLPIQVWIAKALLAQGKQFNLQNLLLRSGSINFALPNIYAGFQDSLTALPTTGAGANQGAGWAALQLITSRPANILEKLLSTGTGTQAASATMGYEGSVNENEIGTAMGWSF